MLYVLADTKGGSGWVPNKYTLNLDSQEAGNVERSVTYGSRYGTLPTPTRTGYTFLGWFTNATGGTQVFAGTTVNSECNHTLYAHWLAKTFTVTYDANGGTPAKQIRNATYDLGVADTPDTPRRAGFSFTGWFTAKTGGKKVSDETLATITANQTLYARWEVYVNRYDISLDAQGGWVSTDSVQVSENDAYGALPVPTLPDYAFLGWYADRDCAGEKITAATLVTQSQSHTLYAKWLYAVMPVTFKGNGGYPASQTQTQMYGDRYILPEAPEREGYTFLGWFTDSAATGVPITASARVTETAEFYAKWALAGAVPVAYTIADGPGTITLSPANGQAVKGKAVTLTAKPAKNALFVDWSTGATTASIKVTPEEDTVYVARFRMKEDCAAPVIENIIPPECRMVGVQFDMQVQINDDAKPVKFTATNLPAGLKIDAATGVISGVPTKTGTFDKATVKVTGVANAKQFASITLPQMTIEALPWDAQGVFNGVLADSSSRNLCGSFSITVSATGKITAKIVSIDGTWTISAPSWTKSSSDVFSATIKTDKGQILNLESSTRHDEDLTWMSVNFYSTDAQGNVNGEYFASGVRNQFANSKDESYGAARALISAYTGYYTLDLLPEGIISYEGMGGIYNVPDGGGYLTATIDAKGSAKFSGKLADGTAVSGSSTVFAFRQGTYTCLYIPVSILLYGSKGGIWNAGDFCIGSDGNGRIGAGGRFAWLYPGKVPAGKTPATEDRFHIDILSEGGLYNKAANLADYYAGRTFSTDSCSVVLEADGKGGIKLPKGVDNPGAVTLTLNKTTGLFSGKLNIYNLDDPTAKPISVSHQGVLLQYERIRGRGFYLIPETWKSDDAKPVSYAIKRSYPVGID